MKISYNWLKELINFDNNVKEISNLLTGTGLEVEHIEHFQNIKGGLEGIVIGAVMESSKHPNADKLSICKVDIGTGENKQIVCGAPNVAAGQKVLVATVGATLYPTKGEPFKISKSKIRGEVSEGMICAEDELGLGESHDGILVLPVHYEIGKPAATYFDIYTDYVFEIGLTANRGDATSHLGVARDIRAVTGVSIQIPEADLPPTNTPSNTKVTIEDSDSCKRYSCLNISNITVKESPQWLQNKLRAIGLNPINNIVDSTNYVLHELGQPLHAFDADKIEGNQIIVKKASPDSKFTTLDKTERVLKGHECLICDSTKPLAIAGVFGGLHSGISKTTKNILLESAYFDSVSIRKTAKAHSLSTDASFRYERGTDPDMVITALNRVASLILAVAGGEISSEIIDRYPNPIKPVVLEFSLVKSNQLIGKEIEKNRVISIFKALDIEVLAEKGETLTLSIPPYRSDVTRQADVTEEILRIYGLNNIEIGNDIKSTISYNQAEQKSKFKNNLANFLSANGFNEIATNTLTKSAYYDTEQLKNAVKILNPLSNDLDIMRLDMVQNMLEVVQYNNNRKLQNLRIFEFGKTYYKGSAIDNAQQILDGYTEKSHLAFCICGKKEAENWNSNQQATNYFTIKGIVQSILAKSKLHQAELNVVNHPLFDFATSIAIGNQEIGILGQLNTSFVAQFDIDIPVFYANIDFNMLHELNLTQKTIIKQVSVFPAVKRDLALLIDEKINYAQLEKVALKTDNKLIKNINVFDIYKGDKIASGKKSYALSFILQDESKTLTDQEIDTVMNKLIKNYEKEIGATLRV